MPYKPASLAEIDNKLREDFRRRLVEAGYQQADVNDPVLRILFRSFASQLEALYAAPEHVREACLDELISGLGFDPRMARPAQTVVRFYTDDAFVIAAGSPLVGATPAGEKLIFATDETVSVSGARIAFAAAYQDGALRLAAGMHLPDDLLSAQPNYDPIAVSLGPGPCLYLVIENLPESHLSGHSFFFDVSSSFPEAQRALLRSTWCVASADGRFEASGILRPRRGNAGVRVLEWLHGGGGDAAGYRDRPELPDGFYAGKVVLFSDVPRENRSLCAVPPPLAGAVSRLFRGPGADWRTPRAWLRILLPENVPHLHEAIQSISLHAISASNVTDFNQTITVERQGTSIPVSREAGTTHFLVAPLSVTGEDNVPYISEYESSPDPGAGRYAVRNGRIDLSPARHPDGSIDGVVTLRTWVTSGELANTVPAGKVQSFLKPDDSAALRMNNPMPAAGGSNGETFDSAQARFSRALLSRDRIVTRADLDSAVRGFDERIVAVSSQSALEPSPRGLVRVERVTLSLDAARFQDPDEESRVLRDELEQWLRAHAHYGLEILVDCEWTERARA
jgi:hypothetical protein